MMYLRILTTCFRRTAPGASLPRQSNPSGQRSQCLAALCSPGTRSPDAPAQVWSRRAWSDLAVSQGNIA
jgi:hypothetical protein